MSEEIKTITKCPKCGGTKFYQETEGTREYEINEEGKLEFIGDDTGQVDDDGYICRGCNKYTAEDWFDIE